MHFIPARRGSRNRDSGWFIFRRMPGIILPSQLLLLSISKMDSGYNGYELIIPIFPK